MPQAATDLLHGKTTTFAKTPARAIDDPHELRVDAEPGSLEVRVLEGNQESQRFSAAGEKHAALRKSASVFC
jgi:hypothetical protein